VGGPVVRFARRAGARVKFRHGHGEDRVREDLLARCRGELIEPPSADRVTEIVRSALRQAEQTLVTRVAARLDPGAIGRLEALVGLEDEADVDRPDALATIKTDPGNVSLDSLLAEIAKLSAVRRRGVLPLAGHGKRQPRTDRVHRSR